MQSDQDFARRLAALMKERNATQASLARMMNTSQSTVSRWLAGSIPHQRTLDALADVLYVRRPWLSSGVGQKEPGGAPTSTFDAAAFEEAFRAQRRLTEPETQYITGVPLPASVRIALSELSAFASREQIGTVAGQLAGFHDVTSDPLAASVINFLTNCALKKQPA